MDPLRRRLLIGAAYEAAALATPVMRWLLAAGREVVDEPSGAAHAGRQEVREVREAAALFARWDSRYGGGSMRLAATSYLESRVAGLLRDAHDDAVGHELFAAAAELTRVVGWSTYDIGLHGLAQRHLVQALRLAQEAGDAACGADILTTLSAQARYLGYPQQALDLAQAGRRGRYSNANSLTKCYLSEARAHAWLVRHGDPSSRRPCLHALGRAEDSLSRARGNTDASSTGVLDEGKLATEKAHAYLDLGFHAPGSWAGEAHDWAQTALDIRESGFTRGRSLAKLTLSRAHLQRSDLAAACTLGEEVLDEIRGLASTHPAGYIREFQDELKPYATDAKVRSFNDKAHMVLT